MILAKQNDYLKDLIQTVEENTKEIKKNIPPDKQIQVPGVFSEKETKIIISYTKAYKVKDFYNKENVIFEQKAYKKEITYKIKEN